MSLLRRVHAVVGFALLGAAIGWRATAATLQAGWATVDITPNLDGGRKPVLSGLMVPRFPDKVDHPVQATALAIAREGGAADQQALLLSCDVAVGTHNQWAGKSLAEELRERLTGRIPGLDLTRLVLMCTHTHNAPSLMEGQYDLPNEPWVIRPSEYREFVLSRLENVVREAWKKLQPAATSWALGTAVAGYNRR